MPSGRQHLIAVVLAGVLTLAAAWYVVRSPSRGLDVGFWFESVSYGPREAMADRLGGALTAEDLQTIETTARYEVTRAFAGLPILVSDSREARYRVRVVQELRNALRPKYPGPAGESRVLAGFGGQGAVNFRALVSAAVAHSPSGADRAEVVKGIGRGVGRTAVHELAHQLLGSAPVDATADRSSYEFRSADRREHFYGDVHWAHAWPRLQRRVQ